MNNEIVFENVMMNGNGFSYIKNNCFVGAIKEGNQKSKLVFEYDNVLFVNIATGYPDVEVEFEDQ